jgi:hypothetical protein
MSLSEEAEESDVEEKSDEMRFRDLSLAKTVS